MSSVVPPTSAVTLGVCRALVCAVLLMNALWEFLPSVANVPLELRRNMGVANVIPGAVFTSDTLLCAIQIATVLGLTMAMVGWRTRWALPATAPRMPCLRCSA